MKILISYVIFRIKPIDPYAMLISQLKMVSVQGEALFTLIKKSHMQSTLRWPPDPLLQSFPNPETNVVSPTEDEQTVLHCEEGKSEFPRSSLCLYFPNHMDWVTFFDLLSPHLSVHNG